MKERIVEEHFEVFVESIYGSDVVHCKSLQEAIESAEKWKEKNKIKDKIAITKVTEELLMEI